MLSIVLPVMDAHEVTDRAIDALISNASNYNNIDIIVVDNASEVPYGTHMQYGIPKKITIIRNEQNVAGFEAFLQASKVAKGDIILWMHNDVLIHEVDYDTRILREFAKDPKLAIAGFFGAPGVSIDGGRMGSMGNMLGKEWGTPQHMHGMILEDVYPAVVFDALAMIINRPLFNELFSTLDIEVTDIPTHHWNDRILPLLFVLNGYHALTIGVGFDHKGGVSSLGAKYRELAERWSKNHNIPFERDWDYTFYHYGEKMFRALGGDEFPVRVDSNHKRIK